MAEHSGNAFPAKLDIVDRGLEGLSKREFFAALAMVGTLTSPPSHDPDDIADYALKVADALLFSLDES